jgi:phosphatidate cytidylyltransferase
MALHVQTFKTRALTAGVFAAIMLLGLLWNAWVFIILFFVIHFGCWEEYIKLMRKVSALHFNRNVILGFFYISLPILLLIDLRMTPVVPAISDNEFKVIPCGIIFSIWINDTMAYIVGSFIGKTPLSSISPKKTWEGTIGGAVLCVVVMSLLGTWHGLYPTMDWVCISALCAVFGTLGDLLESKIKRLAGVKDSGTLMPGHGGFMDRFDSLLIATPAVWLYVYLWMK